MAQDMGTALGWDDDAQVQDSQFEVLPEGEYTYEVTNFKRERFDGSAKMSACPIAVLQLRCTNAQTSGTGFCRLFLNTKVLWRICKFFKSCGLLAADAPEGATFPMSLFEQVVGCSGRVKVTVTTSEYQGKTYTNNEFDFVVPNVAAPRPHVAAPAPAPAPQQQMAWGGQGF